MLSLTKNFPVLHSSPDSVRLGDAVITSHEPGQRHNNCSQSCQFILKWNIPIQLKFSNIQRLEYGKCRLIFLQVYKLVIFRSACTAQKFSSVTAYPVPTRVSTCISHMEIVQKFKICKLLVTNIVLS